MNRKLVAIIGIAVIALGVYFFAVSGNENQPKEGEAQDVKQLVKDYSVGNITDVSASITSHELIVTNSDESKLSYDLPEDEFFVSIAPYVETTHSCAIHNLTGCQGELVEEEFEVNIEDEEGNLVMDHIMTSQANGFIDLWLPRDKTYHVTITHDGKVVESEISTFEGDNTCITTMQLNEKKNV